jgi:hypothetical protein
MKVTNYKRTSDVPIEYEITFDNDTKVTVGEPCSLCDHWDLTEGYDEECGVCCHFYTDQFTYEN